MVKTFKASLRSRAKWTQHKTGACHAESLAVAWLLTHKHYIKRGTKIEFFVYRKTKKGELSMAKPCVHCSKLLRDLTTHHNIKPFNIKWTNSNGIIKKTKNNKMYGTHISSGTRKIILK